MTAKQYLKQAYRLNELITSDLAELHCLKTLATSLSAIRYDQDKIQNGNAQSSRVESLVLKICDLEKTIDQEVDAFVSLKSEIRTVINAVENPDERLLLRLRYVEFLCWPDIQRCMKFEERAIYRLHTRALSRIRIPDKNFQSVSKRH